jgi:hypothetical protein
MNRIIILTSIFAGLAFAGLETTANAKPMVTKHSWCTGWGGQFSDLPSCGGHGGNGSSSGGGHFVTPPLYVGDGGEKDTIKCKKCNK